MKRHPYRLGLVIAVLAGGTIVAIRKQQTSQGKQEYASAVTSTTFPKTAAVAAPSEPKESAAPVLPLSHGFESGSLPPTNETLLAFLLSPSPQLNPAGVQAALDYLRNPAPADSAGNPAAEYFNNVIALLLAQQELPEEFPQVLLAAVTDAGRSLLLRDYATQHLYHIWSRERNPGTKREIEACLMGLTKDNGSPLQAVALLTVSRFADQGPVTRGPNGEKLTPVSGAATKSPDIYSKPLSFTLVDLVDGALRVAGDPTAADNARSCSFNVLLRLGAAQVVFPARKVFDEAQAPEQVRCAALASIGAFGDADTDRPTLDSIPAKPQLVRAAADSALRRLLKDQSGR